MQRASVGRGLDQPAADLVLAFQAAQPAAVPEGRAMPDQQGIGAGPEPKCPG